MKSSASEPDLSVVIYDCPLILVPEASILFVSVADRKLWLGPNLGLPVDCTVAGKKEEKNGKFSSKMCRGCTRTFTSNF